MFFEEKIGEEKKKIAFFLACQLVGKLDEVKKYCNSGFYGVRDKDGNTALHLAVQAGNLETVDYLVNEFLPNNRDFASYFSAVNDNGETALHLAVKNQNLSMVESLLSSNIAADTRLRNELLYALDNKGELAAKTANRLNYREIMCSIARYMNMNNFGQQNLTGGSIPPLPGNISGHKITNNKSRKAWFVPMLKNIQDILHQGILNQDIFEKIKSTIKVLVTKKAVEVDINAKDEDGNTVLHALIKQFGALKQQNQYQNKYFRKVENKLCSLAKKLAKKSAKFTIADNDGNTLLHLAAREGVKEFLAWLVKTLSSISQFDMDIDVINNDGYTAFQLAAAFGKDKNINDILDYLLSKEVGAKIEPLNNLGSSTLYRVLRARHLEGGQLLDRIVFLIERGAEINVKTVNQAISNVKTENQAIKQTYYIKLVELLVRHRKFDINLEDANTLKQTIQQIGNTQIIQRLLQCLEEKMSAMNRNTSFSSKLGM